MITSFNILLLIELIIFQIKADDKLVFVMTHFRHGARAPQYYYADHLDYIKESWLYPGELTALGQRMHYLLGIRNRIRYIDNFKFLYEKFDPHQLLIYSSAYNRTIISVSSQLQGLYPQFVHLGEKITEEQEKNAVPQVDIDCDIINEEIKNLNYSALPYSMMLAPIRMINVNERKITVYDIEGCVDKRDAIKQKNYEALPNVQELVNTFKRRYGEKLDDFYHKKENYDISFIDNFCDAFIAGYTDKREMKELNMTGLNFTELVDYCFNFVKIGFRDYILGDEKHVLAHLEVSRLMKEFIHYMKKRVDADINKEDIDSQYEDYSRPKMMMVSGHDSTISCHEVFLMEAFGLNSSFYIYPKFATQIAFEVTTNKNTEEKKTYKDYYINFYFNDDLKLNVTMQEFLDKVTPHLWSDKQIDDFCGINEDKNESENDLNIFILILFISLTTIFLVIIVILSILLLKKNKKIASFSSISLITKNTEQ
jgi:hypothetical protein